MEWAIALDHLGGEVFLRCGSKLFENGFRIRFVGIFNKAESADHEGITRRLADMVAVGIPIIDNIKIVPFRVREQVIQLISDDDIEIKKENALTGEAGERIITKASFFAVIEAIKFFGNFETRLWVDIYISQ